MNAFKNEEISMKTHKRFLIILAWICPTLMFALTVSTIRASPNLSAETDFTAVDVYIKEQMDELGIPGLALSILQDDHIAHLQGYGVADSSGRAVNPQTPFIIGSVTKSFTALALMQLVEQERICLDKPVQTYLPWFELADKEASSEITVRNLLNHTSGISTEAGEPDWNSQQGLEEAVRGLGELDISQPVGTTFQYANLNYGIAGLIVETVSGQTYSEYVDEHIFEPLEMHHSYASQALAQVDGMAQGYRFMFGRALVNDAPTPPNNLPGGGLIVSAEDLAHYAIAQLNGGHYGKASILSEQGIREMHSPAVAISGSEFHYGMGWAVGSLDGMQLIQHDGVVRNFRSQVYLFPERRLGVILLANAHGFEQMFQLPSIANGVVNLLTGRSAEPVSRDIKMSFLYWAILLLPFVQIIGIYFTKQSWRTKGVRYIIFVVNLYFGFALLWLFGVPNLMGLPISPGNRFFYPELSYGWMLGVALGIGWGVVYTAAYLRKRFLN
jgi:CubicO group peptidase (beta-lactamase class C family)